MLRCAPRTSHIDFNRLQILLNFVLCLCQIVETQIKTEHSNTYTINLRPIMCIFGRRFLLKLAMSDVLLFLIFILPYLGFLTIIPKLLYHRTLAFRFVQRFNLLRSQNLTDPIADFIQRFQLCLHPF